MFTYSAFFGPSGISVSRYSSGLGWSVRDTGFQKFDLPETPGRWANTDDAEVVLAAHGYRVVGQWAPEYIRGLGGPFYCTEITPEPEEN